MRSMKSECLERMVFFGERNHQGLGNNLIEPGVEVGKIEGKVTCRNRLGGMLRYYYRDAA